MLHVELLVAASLLVLVRATDVGSSSDVVRASLRQLFGFDDRPRSRGGEVRVPSAMLRLYKRQRRFTSEYSDTVHFPQRDTRSANTVRSFMHAENPSDINDPFTFTYRFNLSDNPASEHPTAAELRIYRRKLPNPSSPQQQINIYDIITPANPVDEPLTLLLDTRRVDVSETRWEKFDVLPSIVRWLRNPRENHGILVKITKPHSPNPPSDVHVRLEPNPTSILLVFSDDGRRNSPRVRRTASRQERRRHRKARRDLCRRHPLYVDFSDVGWTDWIVAPPGYHAFYCRGECVFPLADHLNATNHAIVQTLVNSVKPGVVPRACCIPTELTPISMLYVDEYDKVVLKNYDKMVVEGCGCR